MSTYTNGKRARRITKIRVDEISEVDRPANGIPFLFFKRDGAPPAPAPTASKPSAPTNELAEYAPRAVRKADGSCEYDGSAIRSLLAGVIKTTGDGTQIPPDDVPPYLTPEDYARQRDRVDRDGVVAVNSPNFYPPVHVPSAVDVTDPVPV